MLEDHVMRKQVWMILALVLVLMTVAGIAPRATAAPMPTAITLNKSDITINLAKNTTSTVKATVEPKGASSQISWTSSDKTVATVNAYGTITGKKVGSATITATSKVDTAVSASVNVTVTDTRMPSTIELNRTSVTLDIAKSKTATLKVTASPAGASAQVKWSSSDKTIVSVYNGQITAQKGGTATITATSKYNSAVTAVCDVTVIDSRVPESLTVNPNPVTIDLAKGKTATLKVSVEPYTASTQVTWSSSDKKIATVAYNGRVTAIKPGSVTITAKSKYDKSVLCAVPVTVVNTLIPETITLSEENLDLLRYETRQLTATTKPEAASTKVTWTTSNARVATVSGKGLVTAVGQGTCTITCASQIDKSMRSTVLVTVTNQLKPTSITLSPDDTAMYMGDTLQLTPAVQPEGACTFYRFTTSNSYVATVSNTGLVTAKKSGKVTITAYSRQTNSVYAKRTILVVPANSPLYVDVPEATLTVNPGKTYALTATVLPASANQGLRFKSSNTYVASVSGTGVITGKAVGNATITVYSSVNSNVLDKVKVKIVNLPAPTSIVLGAEKTTINKGETVQLVATPVPVTADSQFTFTSSNTNRATVTSGGLVTAKSGGYVTITAANKLNKKVTAQIKLFVYDARVPTNVEIEGTSAILDTTESLTLKATVTPESAAGSVKWTTSKSSVVGVSASGKLYARAAGTAVIYCTSTYDGSVKDSFQVTVVNRPAPSSIEVDAGDGYMMIGDTQQITVTPTPSTASTLFTYASSNPSVAEVSDKGLITAKKTGTCTVTVTSKKKTSLKKTLTIRVNQDATTPTDITLSTTGATLGVGDSMTITATVYPTTASQSVTWKSSNPAVLTVSASGKITAQAAGKATITASSGTVTASATFVVMSTTLTTAIPARTTDISGISGNMASIEAIRRSAANELMVLETTGVITASEYNDRLQVLNRAFEMQAFPWITESIQEYWSKSYAYKRYMPGKVYYGLPYIQCGTNGVYTNRQYNVTKAVAQGYYAKSSGAYYYMTSKKLNNMYVGCDCSAFVSMSQWGTSHSASYNNTSSIAVSSYYKTISNWTNMRTGDLMVKSGNHTILFLYYVDAAKTKMMMIEQGGDGNTVICSIQEVSKYKSKGYIIRRKTTYK